MLETINAKVPVGTAGVQQIGEELDKSRPELVLTLHVDIDKVLLPDLK